MERIVLATGGTGGHIFPAIAVAQEIKKRYPAAEVIFLGGVYGPEKKLVEEAGFAFEGLPVRGVVGRGLHGLLSLWRMVYGVGAALAALRKIKPQIVVGFGGYAAFSGVLAAWLRGTSTAIHEQNAYPGRTNIILGRLVQRVFLSLPASGFFSDRKTLVSGNPVRTEIQSAREERRHLAGHEGSAKDHRVRLLVMGGSQGAQAINKAITGGVQELLAAGIELWHQTGTAHYAKVCETYANAGAQGVRVDSFIADMREAYVWADMVVGRAGGSSIAEFLTVEVPSILIPFPYAAHNHQWYNAQSLARRGAALVLEQADFDGSKGSHDVLVNSILALAAAPDVRKQMAAACAEMARPDAASTIVDEMEILVSIDELNG